MAVPKNPAELCLRVEGARNRRIPTPPAKAIARAVTDRKIPKRELLCMK
jgi:hypothetical protein